MDGSIFSAVGPISLLAPVFVALNTANAGVKSWELKFSPLYVIFFPLLVLDKEIQSVDEKNKEERI